MRRMFLLVLSMVLMATTTSSRREGGTEDFGLEPLRESYKEMFLDGSRVGRQIWNPFLEKDLYAFLRQIKEKTDSSVSKFPRKRALSALSRWKPLSSLGIRLKAIHRPAARAPMISMMPEMNLISAESEEGVRPLGQPLRWGRKR